MKKLIFPAALLVAGSSAALAQMTSPPATTTTPPPAATAPSTSTNSMFHSAKTGELRASQLIGTRVQNPAGETIGDINEVILSRDGKVSAVVVGVGGFLGIGERNVAVSYEQIRVTFDQNGRAAIQLNATADQLRAAPEFRITQG
jgi:sporulation protein YlmC with PRC-barrel domain